MKTPEEKAVEEAFVVYHSVCMWVSQLSAVFSHMKLGNDFLSVNPVQAASAEGAPCLMVIVASYKRKGESESERRRQRAWWRQSRGNANSFSIEWIIIVLTTLTNIFSLYSPPPLCVVSTMFPFFHSLPWLPTAHVFSKNPLSLGFQPSKRGDQTPLKPLV